MYDDLLEKIQGTAIWRFRKAEEYPEDAYRNERSGDALLRLYKYIKNLSDHEAFEFLDKVKLLFEDDSDLFIDLLEDSISDFFEDISRLTRSYGFQMEEDPEDFLAEVIEICNKTLNDFEELA